MKRTLTITVIAIVCIFGLYTYLTWGNNGNPRFMHHRYNKVVTQPLAKIGIADAQYKMGLFYLYGSGESKPTTEEVNNAIYWWEKASAKGNEKAEKELEKLIN
ncbi:SEL1-like repeat protein [uncultured Alistipes sp.]|uniref:SEL1-like repeat protein n=1 Tax=uncultured Alistipes sp. TaxID=538949 RepID=UPI0025D64995|nr:SEL1-like repeat protein [uncultured Alistipes sp.]